MPLFNIPITLFCFSIVVRDTTLQSAEPVVSMIEITMCDHHHFHCLMSYLFPLDSFQHFTGVHDSQSHPHYSHDSIIEQL